MVAQSYVVEQVAPDDFTVRYVVSPMGASGIGSVAQNVEAFRHDEHQLPGSVTRLPATVSAERVRELLADDEVVVVLDGVIDANVVPPSDEFVRRSSGRASGSVSRSPDYRADSESERRGDWIVK